MRKEVSLGGKRRHSEDQARASLYARSLIEASLDPLVTISAEGQITDVNEATVQVTGVSREQLIGTDFSSYFTEPGKARAGYQQVFEKGFVTDYPLTIRHALGAETDVLYNAAVYRDDRGQVLGVFAAARDVTATKRAEDEVRMARDFLENLVDTFNALTDIFYTFDLQGRFLRWNNALPAVSGYRPDDIAGMHLTDFFTEEGAQKMTEGVERARVEGHVIVEADILTKQGRAIPYEFVAGLLRDKHGQALGLTGLGRDITQRKAAETEVRESEARYRAIFEYTGAAKCTIEPDLTISTSNYEFKRVTGYAERGSWERPSILEFLTPQASDDFRKYFARMESAPEDAPMHFETALLGNGGTLIMIASMAFIPGSETAVLSLIDITLEKLYERTLEERAQQLSDFLSIAAHELGLPVTVIKGYIQILKDFRDRLDSECIEDVLASIDDASSRLGHLVDELLDASRIEKGRLSMNLGVVDLRTMLETAVTEAGIKGYENEITMTVVDELPLFQGDPEKLMQVVHILLENAAKFSQGQAPIELTAEKAGRELIISVLDSGIGVKAEARTRIFERFFQVEDVSHHSKPGLGLGLSIASEIIAAHGGRIWQEDRSEGGSIFRFALPLRET